MPKSYWNLKEKQQHQVTIYMYIMFVDDFNLGLIVHLFDVSFICHTNSWTFHIETLISRLGNLWVLVIRLDSWLDVD